jgi:hypothetical protein
MILPVPGLSRSLQTTFPDAKMRHCDRIGKGGPAAKHPVHALGMLTSSESMLAAAQLYQPQKRLP